MEFNDRHKEAILKMFADLLKNAKDEDRRGIYKEFHESFWGLWEDDYIEKINNAFDDHKMPAGIVDEWNCYEKECMRKDESPIEFCPMVLEDEKEIVKLLCQELDVSPHISGNDELGTVEDFSKTGYSFIAKKNGKIIGVMMAQKMLEYGSDIIYINDFVIDNAFQGKGIGTKMIEHLIDIIRQNYEKYTALRIMLCTDKNRKAYDIYHKWGFYDSSSSTRYLTRCLIVT